MHKLIAEIARFVEDRTQSVVRTLTGTEAELRSVFHGPPESYLRPVLDILAADGGIECTLGTGAVVVVPVLLPVVPPPEAMPSAGASGLCDRDYLISLRNTPLGKRWVALTPPAAHDVKSVTGASDEFGLSPANSGRAASITDWFHDPLIERLWTAALGRNSWPSDGEKESAKLLLLGFIREADEVSRHDPNRDEAWASLARVHGITPALGSFSTGWSIACGVPPMGDGTVDVEAQRGALDQLADVLETNGAGFTGCAERLKRRASDEEHAVIDEMIGHIRRSAGSALAFVRAPQFYYAPARGTEPAAAPSWWSALTAERITELLDEPRPKRDGLALSMASVVVPAGRGICAVVRDQVVLSASASDSSAPGNLRIAREGLGRGNSREWFPDPDARGVGAITDTGLPLHATPVRYSASADNLKGASVRVVVLDAWQPGVVVHGRTIDKVSLPRKAKAGSETAYECDVSVSGEGRHFLDLYVSRDVRVGSEVRGVDLAVVGSEPLVSLATPPIDDDGPWGLEVVATSECQYDIILNRAGSSEWKVRLHITAQEAGTEGCRSEFDRLLKLNSDRGRSSLEVQIDRQVRIADLQSWILEGAAESSLPYPIVIAPDSERAWNAPDWETARGTVLSPSHFIHDPRPTFEEFRPPEALLEPRARIASRIRGEDGHGLIEAAELGAWMAEPDMAEEVDRYVRAYMEWLDSDPDVAAWADLIVVNPSDGDGTLALSPLAVLINPLHPLRLGWQALAQRTLIESVRSGKPCPAASILDPSVIPDALTLPLRAPTGAINKVTYLSTDANSDYWSVLWHSGRVGSLLTKGASAPFGREFGIQLGGVTSGFRVSQVKRALEDVAVLMAAKPVLNVLVTSASTQGAASTEGIIEWATAKFGPGEDDEADNITLGPRVVQVFDERDRNSRPTSVEVANLQEDTRGAVRWYGRLIEGSQPDLGIISQLETANASAEPTRAASPLSTGALTRHRVRSQLRAASGAFLTESRMGQVSGTSGDALADHVAALTARLENLGDSRLGFTFAPRVGAIQGLFEDKRAEFVAVSSSAVDPACFLGGWLDNAYLWDYELPSYSNRPGDTSGYYLLSKIKRIDADALRAVLSKLPGCASLDDDQIQGILLEVSRRGIPTVRGLAAGHSGASGDLGLFLAGRLLQDEFRLAPSGRSLLPVIRSDGSTYEVALVVPVDPFRGYLMDLQRAVRTPAFLRPDLVVMAFTVSDSRVACRVTPVEVKYRQDSALGAGAREALEQASSFSSLLKAVRAQGETGGGLLWKLAFRHLLGTLADFGFRVYSQQSSVLQSPEVWDTLHAQVSDAIISGLLDLQVDEAGRLIVFDSSSLGGVRDVDNDRLGETLIVSPADAARIARGEAADLYDQIRHAVRDWGLFPHGYASILEAATYGLHPDATAGNVHEPAPPRQALPISAGGDQGGDAHLPAAGARANGGAPAAAAASAPQPDVEVPAAPEAADGASAQPEDHEITQDGAEGTGDSVAPGQGIVVEVGDSIDAFRTDTMVFRPSVTALNQLNVGIVGDLGTGKTQLVKSLVYQVASASANNDGVKPRFLILDYKRDYSAPEFVKAVGAKVVSPRNLPLNLFDTTGSTSHPAWMSRFLFFADVLDKIYGGVGPVQRNNLKAAVKSSHELAVTQGLSATIYDVQEAYEGIVKGKPDSPLSIISDMTDMELFSRTPTEGSSFGDFFDGVVVLSLADLGQADKTKNMVVAIILNLFYEYMLTRPKRPYRGADPQLRTIDSYLLVDEADSIMRYEFDVLRTILLQGREFGVGVLLSSQYLRHFKVGATDYREPLLTWFIHKVPNVTPQELSTLGLSGAATQAAERIKQLNVHECLYKTFDVPGAVVRARPFFQLLNEGNIHE